MLYELTSNIDAIILTDDNMELITKYCVFPVIIYSLSTDESVMTSIMHISVMTGVVSK